MKVEYTSSFFLVFQSLTGGNGMGVNAKWSATLAQDFFGVALRNRALTYVCHALL